MKIKNPIIAYILLTAKRDWLFLAIAILLIINLGLSQFLSSSSLVEERQMSIVFISSFSRLIIIFGLILFSSFHVYRSYENKEIEYILAKNISRNKFIFLYWLGFVILSILLILPLTIFFIILKIPLQAVLLWSLSLLIEAMIICAFSLIATIILHNAMLGIMGTLAFYIISRLIGYFIFTIHNSTLGTTTITFKITSKVIYIISLLIPRLDLFGQSIWLVENNINYTEILYVFLQSIIYIPIILLITMIDFRRKEL